MIPRQFPKEPVSYYEYAIESGGSVLNRKRYDTAEDAYFDSLIRNGTDIERIGKVMIKRRVVKRKVTIGDWEQVDVEKEITDKNRRKR